MRTSHRAIPILVALVALATAGCSKEPPKPAPTPPPGAMAAPASPGQVAAPPAAATPMSKESTEVAATPAPSTAGAAHPGAQVFATYCQTCHGASGHGDGPAAAALNPKPASFSTGAFKYDANGNGAPGEIEDIQAVVRDGAAKYGGSPLMAPWSMLSADQQQAVASYVKSLSGS